MSGVVDMVCPRCQGVGREQLRSIYPRPRALDACGRCGGSGFCDAPPPDPLTNLFDETERRSNEARSILARRTKLETDW